MIYYLNKSEVPTIPVPHDCIIDEVSIDGDYLVFRFADRLRQGSSMDHIDPDAKFLIIRIHLLDEFDVYRKELRKWRRNGIYKEIDSSLLNKSAKKGRLEYLYHYVGYQSIIIKLYCETYITLDIHADFIEYEFVM